MSEKVSCRWPAEWEPQDAILLAWPHSGTDWVDNLADVEKTYVELISAIVRFETAVILVPSAELQWHAEQCLAAAGIIPDRIRFFRADYDDTWLRDTGPVTLRCNGSFRVNDFRFTGWGGKFSALRDDRLVSALYASGLFRNTEYRHYDFALEGGAIDNDGAGTVLTTFNCLHQRHPHLDHQQLRAQLASFLAADRILILDSGQLEGDDTDAHIDTLARFASSDTIVFQACDDPADSHYSSLAAMRLELESLRTRDGKPYQLVALPWAPPIFSVDDRRLAASYANFLIINGAVLMPAYGVAVDAVAERILSRVFPDREVIAVSARALIEQNGSLHCVTMQLPLGVLNA